MKTCLLEALKSAANIRGLKGEECITLCVKGSSTKPGVGRVRFFAVDPGSKGDDFAALRGLEGPPPTGTILSLRVKKSDVDAFAAGRLDLNQFRQKALISIYEANVGISPVYGGFGGGYGGYGGYGSSKAW